MQSTREQINSLTGLRGVAAAWVMLMHFREITPTRVWKFPILDTLIANGAYGVDVFFVLSGFIMCHVYASSFGSGLPTGQIRQFMLYRFARLYPVHIVTFALMLVLLTAKLMTSGANGIPERYDPSTIVMTMLMMHAWIPGMQTPNMPAWSVSAEWFAYMLFPALCFFLSHGRWTALLYVAIGLGLACLDTIDHYPLLQVLSGF
ncbi:MAG: acyltransferase, partial [Methylobacteriaceae bacterium]|nr:acyltransferase [Methylobacteriaceae bacterium]